VTQSFPNESGKDHFFTDLLSLSVSEDCTNIVRSSYANTVHWDVNDRHGSIRVKSKALFRNYSAGAHLRFETIAIDKHLSAPN